MSDEITQDVTGAAVGDEGAAASVAIVGDEGAKETKPDFSSFVPEDYKEKPYIKELLKTQDPNVELFKQFDNLQKKLGERPPARPADDAPDEEWAKFLEPLKPKTADEYEIPLPELGEDKKELAEFIKSNRDEEFQKQVKQMLHEEGVPKRLANKLAQRYVNLEAQAMEKAFTKQRETDAALESEFQDVFKKSFGGDQTKAEAAGKEFLKEFVPEKLRPLIAGLSNEALAVMAAASLGVKAKYEAEDTFTDVAKTKSDTVDALKDEMRAILRMPEAKNTFHPDYPKHQARLKEIRGLMDARLTKS